MTTTASAAGSAAASVARPTPNVSTAPPEGPAPTASPAPDGAPSLPYATPWPRRGWAASDRAHRLFWQGVRKVIFAGGLGLLVYGAASVASGVNRHAAPVAAAWGVAFVAMMLPAPRRGARRKKRRRTRPAAGGAAARPASGI